MISFRKVLTNNSTNYIYNWLEINCIKNWKSKFHLGMLGKIENRKNSFLAKKNFYEKYSPLD